MNDDLGDRVKAYEAVTTNRRAFKGQPLIARLDGKAFHTFTKGLQRPYDERLSNLMIDTMKALVDCFGATVGYTQSDEATLVWLSEPHDAADLPFSGRLQKLESLTAAFATAHFNRHLPRYLPEKVPVEGRTENLPLFDSRAFVVPTVVEAYNTVLWRQQDCTKNAISMAAQSMLSHKELQGKHGPEMQELMFSRFGVNFNDYPAFFKRGTFARRVRAKRELTAEQLARIPEQHRPTGPVERSFIDVLDIWLTKQPDPIKALFGDTEIVN